MGDETNQVEKAYGMPMEVGQGVLSPGTAYDTRQMWKDALAGQAGQAVERMKRVMSGEPFSDVAAGAAITLHQRASILRAEADALDALARGLPQEMTGAATEGLLMLIRQSVSGR